MLNNEEVTISNYHGSSSKNYGVNSLLVTIGVLDFYFSYQTVIAFRSPETGLVVSENDWGPTTGKHLNSINPLKSERVSRDEFQKQLATVLDKYNLIHPRIYI